MSSKFSRTNLFKIAKIGVFFSAWLSENVKKGVFLDQFVREILKRVFFYTSFPRNVKKGVIFRPVREEHPGFNLPI